MSEQQFTTIVRSSELDLSRIKVITAAVKIVSCSHVYSERYSSLNLGYNFNNLSKQKPSETSAVKLYKGTVVTNINDIDVICVSCLQTYIYHSL